MKKKLTQNQIALITIVVALVACLLFSYVRFGTCEYCGQTEILKRYIENRSYGPDQVEWVCSDCRYVLKMW